MDNFCVSFVCNRNYLDKFFQTYIQLRTNGNYKGHVVLIIGDDLNESEISITDNNLEVKKFPDINFSTKFMNIFANLDRLSHWKDKIFQYHKFYLFHQYMKKWNYVFYMDCRIFIYREITPFFSLFQENKIVAHSDAYPSYVWKLDVQFVKLNPYYEQLRKDYDLDKDYFQTTIMLYDTKLIQENTFQNLIDLAEKYPISVTNDQGITNLYFHKFWKPIMIKDEKTNIHFYDYMRRKIEYEYIMTKIKEFIN
jgi:hypothetical protein